MIVHLCFFFCGNHVVVFLQLLSCLRNKSNHRGGGSFSFLPISGIERLNKKDPSSICNWLAQSALSWLKGSFRQTIDTKEWIHRAVSCCDGMEQMVPGYQHVPTFSPICWGSLQKQTCACVYIYICIYIYVCRLYTHAHNAYVQGGRW